MKDVSDVFRENLSFILDVLDSGNLRSCFIASSNLTLYSVMSDYDDGVMITEVFQGVFSEIGPLFDEYLIEETDGKKLIDEMKKHMKNIIKCYNDKNKDNLYSALKNLRYVATKFQIQCVKSAKRKNTVSESL